MVLLWTRALSVFLLTPHSFAPQALSLGLGVHSARPKSQTLNPHRTPPLNPKHRFRQGLAVGLGVKSAVAEEQVTQVESKPKFRRLPRIQFIAALGVPSGVRARSWKAFLG